MIGNNGILQYLRFCLFEILMWFLLCLYSAVSLNLVREQHFIRIVYHKYYIMTTELFSGAGMISHLIVGPQYEEEEDGV